MSFHGLRIWLLPHCGSSDWIWPYHPPLLPLHQPSPSPLWLQICEHLHLCPNSAFCLLDRDTVSKLYIIAGLTTVSTKAFISTLLHRWSLTLDSQWKPFINNTQKQGWMFLAKLIWDRLMQSWKVCFHLTRPHSKSFCHGRHAPQRKMTIQIVISVVQKF